MNDLSISARKLMTLFMVIMTIVTTSLLACTQTQTPVQQQAPPQQQAAPSTTAPQTVAKADWERKWESTLDAGKKEGKVSVYAQWGPPVRTALQKAFKDKYGIELEFSPFNSGGEIQAKVEAENRGGLSLADAFGTGGATLVGTMKPAGLLGNAEPLLILPEVIDPKLWSGGRFPFMDKDKKGIGMIAALQRYVFYNNTMVKPGEITTYKDLLKPQYKDKIILNDPSVTNAGSSFMSHLAYQLWNVDEAMAYLQQLVKQHNVSLQRDSRLVVESVARGKYAIGVGPIPEVLEEFLVQGAPMDIVINKEGAFITYAAGAIGFPTQLAHPNATAVFANWLLSKEGQTVFYESFGNPSLRTDVSTKGIRSAFLPQPGETIYLDSEEFIIQRRDIPARSANAIAAALK